MWDEVKLCHVHGPVVSYEVHFRDVEGGSTDLMHSVTVLAAEERILKLTNLEIYWMYGVRIKAFTVNGPGPLSPEITGRTDEWGMSFIISLPGIPRLEDRYIMTESVFSFLYHRCYSKILDTVTWL